ncbi:PREDICTED: matrix metalloproteinase-2-like [Trachymyrmex cornetzi]|uniref:matrix metalloproteinase-2-like n=1 Tax=Trachymyrmex cornetzi TaxID=471704 RepID=UPI00084EE594|nr:PREDICTED: matrix metalloproteinase-2-like [Trachymyrmex cornetzi]
MSTTRGTVINELSEGAHSPTESRNVHCCMTTYFYVNDNVICQRCFENTNSSPQTQIGYLCTLQYVDTVLVLHHRIFVTYQRYVWSIDINDAKYDGPHILNSYMDFLPNNFSLSAAYQRPSGKLVLFIHDVIYMVEYPSFKLKEGWPKRLSSLGFPPNIFINTVVNTNRGQTYVIFNNNDVAQIDECNMSVRSYHSLQAIFPGIPSAPTLAFRYMDGNLYFAKKQQFYQFNEFTRTVTKTGKFDINILNVECSRDGLLQQMQNILTRLFRSSTT